MGNTELDHDRQELITNVGVFFEKTGLTKVSGQIVGLLMVSQEPQITMSDITNTLHVSKSSVSTSLKLLIQMGFMRKINKLGDRKDYYEIDGEIWRSGFLKKLQATTSFMVYIDQAREIIGDTMTNQRIMLEEMYAMYEFFSHELVELNKKWEIKRQELLDSINQRLT